jgi:short-subunit dehydrogenase
MKPLIHEPRVVITGASTGIGRGLALHLAKQYKAKMVLTARSQNDLETCRDLVLKAGGQAEIVVGNLIDEAVCTQLVPLCAATYGGIDMLVNNAGMAIPGPFGERNIEDWRKLFELNFFAPLKLTYEALPYLKQSKSPKLVNISSVAGKIAFPGSVSYCASKFALTGLSEGLAAELDNQVDVLTVCPGWVRTEFFEKNLVPGSRNPTVMAEQNNPRGLFMRYFLSMSTADCVKAIVKALAKGGSQELILTMPGQIAERLHGLAPQIMRGIARRVPASYNHD